MQAEVASGISMASFTSSSKISEDSLARHSSTFSQCGLPLSLTVQPRVSSVVAFNTSHSSEPLAG